jgi:hypothetical protein
VIELLFADLHGGRAVSVYDTLGWTDLGPVLGSLALAGPAVGLMVAVALPLYRWRYGGVVVGLLGYLAFLAGLIAGLMIGAPHPSGTASPSTFEIIQGFVGFVCIGVIAALVGQDGRSMALGEPDDGSSGSWWIW